MTQRKTTGHALVIVTLLLLVLTDFTGISAATVRKSMSTLGEEVEGKSLPTEEVYDKEKLEIWSKSIVDVIDNKLSYLCRMMIRGVNRPDETPRSACSQLKDNKALMRMACTESDVDFMEEAVCGYWSIVIPTESPASSVTSSPRSPDDTAVEDEEPSSSLEKSSSARSRSSFTVKNVLSLSSTSPGPEEIAMAPIHDDAQSGFPSRDSRLSDKCNQIFPHVAQTMAADENKTSSGCKQLRHFADISAEEAGSDGTHPGAKVLLSSCTKYDLHLMHGILCAHHDRADPEHALQGEQKKRVNYVIKTELTSSCRDALGPLGEGHMREDVEDSCLTLRGADGDQLVKSSVCTRRDMDNVLRAVCDSAPGVASHGYQALLMLTLYTTKYLFAKFQGVF